MALDTVKVALISSKSVDRLTIGNSPNANQIGQWQLSVRNLQCILCPTKYREGSFLRRRPPVRTQVETNATCGRAMCVMPKIDSRRAKNSAPFIGRSGHSIAVDGLSPSGASLDGNLRSSAANNNKKCPSTRDSHQKKEHY